MTVKINETEKHAVGWGHQDNIAWFTFSTEDGEQCTVDELTALFTDCDTIELYETVEDSDAVEKVGLYKGYSKLINIQRTQEDDADYYYYTATVMQA